ncbi:MAG TPA: RNA polymerase sigma factor [Microbacteriaceae bacterium]
MADDDGVRERAIALAGAAKRGDTVAMNRLLDALAPYVGTISASIALDHGADAAQEAMIVIFRSLRGLRDPHALFGWVRQITVREALPIARREARQLPDELEDIPARGDPQLSTDVGDVMAHLSPEHRAILLLRDLEGFTEEQAAHLLQVPRGTAKSRLNRARGSFRKEWES